MMHKDEIFASCLDLLQEYFLLKNRLDESLRKAFSSMMDVKYAGNWLSVGTAQIPNTVKATRFVKVDEVVGQKLLSQLRKVPSDQGAGRAKMRPLGGDEDLVKLLGKKYDCGIEDLGSCSDERESSSDPMMWYGSLVPSQLKSCKENFELVMKHVDQLVQLQCKLNSNLVRLKQ